METKNSVEQNKLDMKKHSDDLGETILLLYGIMIVFLAAMLFMMIR